MYTTHQPHVTPRMWNQDRALTLSILIQTAYEQEQALSIVYQTNQHTRQFCGYLEQIDPAESWIRLRNEGLQQTIPFADVMTIDLDVKN
jgi:hypothetical protein